MRPRSLVNTVGAQWPGRRWSTLLVGKTVQKVQGVFPGGLQAPVVGGVVDAGAGRGGGIFGRAIGGDAGIPVEWTIDGHFESSAS